MSWISQLSKTYDSAWGRTVTDESKVPLLPLHHTTVQAQISIVVDFDGNFVSSSVIPKESATTIIPCTESSGARTSGKSPHPLNDTLEYIAGDLLKFYDAEGKDAEKIRESHGDYLNLLKSWSHSDYGNKGLSAVLRYVEKGNVISDLLKTGILKLDDDNKIINKWDKKSSEDEPELYSVITGDVVKSFVRWSISTPDGDVNLSNADIWSIWRKFIESDEGENDICMVTGEFAPIATNHPAKIRNAGDKAKLISSNDTSGFTYRGRFISDREACTIGVATSHKAHNALRWLIGKQGFRYEDWCVVSWMISAGGKTINPTDDPADIFLANLTDEDQTAYTGKISADAINSMIRGYQGEVDDEGIATMILDSASKGRLAIVYYREFSGSEFESNLNHWYATCSWPRRYKDSEKKSKQTALPLPLTEIVKCVYGRSVDEKLLKSTLNRLTPCVIERAPVPRDIVQSAINNACKPLSYEKWEWENILSLACALYKKENKKEEYEMVLDKERKTRDYLFGRLLAVADAAENRALFLAGEKRETNAMRSMQRFADRPNSTWRHLNLALAPYRPRLPNNGSYYDKIISDIMDLFDADDFISDKQLSGEFLLGFYTQRADFFIKKEDRDEKETQEE
jgi:CRISPR-associated protein Csd1